MDFDEHWFRKPKCDKRPLSDERVTKIIESLLLQLSGLIHWKIALLATGLLLQGAVFTVFPEEVVVTTLGVLWSQGRIGFFEAMLAVQCGLLPANFALVFMGNRLGTRLFHIRPFSWVLKPEAVEASLAKLRRAGIWVVFSTRFIPLIRGPVYFATGLSRLPLLHFIRTDALASCIQIPLLLLLGGTIGKNSGSLLEAYQRVGSLMLLLIGSVAVISIAKSRKRQRPSKSAAYTSL